MASPIYLTTVAVGGKDAILHGALKILIHGKGQMVRIHCLLEMVVEPGDVAEENGQQLFFRARLRRVGSLANCLTSLGER